MASTELYKGFLIESIRTPDGRWGAKIRKADGTDLTTQVPPQKLPFIQTSPDTLTSDAAIELAKRAIDGGGMS